MPESCRFCGAHLAIGAIACFRCGHMVESASTHAGGTGHVAPTQLGTLARGELLEGQWRLLKPIGRGSAGVVWQGVDVGLDRPVALKVLHAGPSAEGFARFERDARAIAQLEHPGLVPVLGIGHHQGQPFMVMKLVEGRTLAELMHQSGGRLPLREAAQLIAHVADTLDFLHATGLVHGDLKPSHVLVGADRQPVLVDAGFEAGGDPHYRAPEALALRGTSDRRSDVFSLGCLAYEAITSETPFAGEARDVIAHQLHTPPPDASALVPYLPGELGAVLMKAMAKIPLERHATAGELAAELLRVAEAAGPGRAPVLTKNERTPVLARAEVTTQPAARRSPPPQAPAAPPAPRRTTPPQGAGAAPRRTTPPQFAGTPPAPRRTTPPQFAGAPAAPRRTTPPQVPGARRSPPPPAPLLEAEPPTTPGAEPPLLAPLGEAPTGPALPSPLAPHEPDAQAAPVSASAPFFSGVRERDTQPSERRRVPRKLIAAFTALAACIALGVGLAFTAKPPAPPPPTPLPYAPIESVAIVKPVIEDAPAPSLAYQLPEEPRPKNVVLEPPRTEPEQRKHYDVRTARARVAGNNAGATIDVHVFSPSSSGRKPIKAEVWLDQEKKGSSPMTLAVSAGPHALELITDQYPMTDVEVYAVPGGRQVVEVEMVPPGNQRKAPASLQTRTPPPSR